MTIDNLKCVVMDATYTPVDIMPAKVALALCFKNKANILEVHEDIVIRTVNEKYDVPKQIVLNYIIKKKTRVYNIPAQLNNRNLFIRDDHTCQYCGRKQSELKKDEKLTRDHVQPRDLGGQDVWGNVVTACNKCNNKKANIPLEETGMTIKKKPHTPTVFEIMSKGPMGRKIPIS